MKNEIKTKAKYVTDWWLTKLPNEVYNLTINTTEKWMSFHAYNDNTFIIGHKEDDSQKEYEEKLLIIPEFLPNLEKGLWIRTIQENKDQINVYWIPFYSSWIKEKKCQLINEMNNHE
jgi:hypothetical protein